MNFQYIEDLDVEYLNANSELKETVLSLNEHNAEKSVAIKRRYKRLKKVIRG